MEKGKGKWVRINYVHIQVATCLNETKKGGRQVNQIKTRIKSKGDKI